jgi:hypothetical protein
MKRTKLTRIDQQLARERRKWEKRQKARQDKLKG